MEMGKLGNKSSYKKKIKIGILGGSFDPAHKGHIAISKEEKKKFKLKNVIWAITKKNPLKNKSNLNILERIKFAKKIIKSNTFIKVKFYENIINSNKTINLINHIRKNKKFDIYFIIGADNLITFHKWYKWKLISQKCNIIVFDRQGYKKKSFESVAFNQLKQKKLKFVTFKKVNISSSKLRKI
jgi:nicotinate-nucleotide adenylyltransferase